MNMIYSKRLAPEHPLPTAYKDSWNALQVVQARSEPWINDYADFNRFFLVGDSAGANISHHLAFRTKQSGLRPSKETNGGRMVAICVPVR
ncbi:BnaC08g04420D [Brassica napus]|uniref:BnaC08g04420D protein n=1 Tax=Brassica napus TaxID=3708 RepID=A0A078FZN4_BRANA|nr:BnaC08g04420D [Brassica napus]